MSKIVTKQEFHDNIRPMLKAEGKTIALCHGVFDLVHPGHIIHFRQAEELADVLVVSITAARFVRKGPGRPYFDDSTRMHFLEAIEVIDYVMLSECYTVDDIIEAVEPDFYVKGAEYRSPKDDITGMITEERKLVERHGGRMAYTDGDIYSSTKLINNGMAGLPEDVKAHMMDIKGRYSMADIRHYAAQAGHLNVLVLGDAIVDRYTYCTVQGLMSKDMAYSAREIETEDFLGGAMAVARHLSSFTNRLTLMSVVGDEPDINIFLKNGFRSDMNLELVHSKERPTIVKHRFLSRNAKREQYSKVFVINNIPEKPDYERAVREELYGRLEDNIAGFDVVFVCDFGHGMVDPRMIDIVQEKARFIVLNCQTNSSNKGMNLITKYSRADAFSLDQEELKLAVPGYDADETDKLIELSRFLHGNGWLTRGAEGAYGIEGEKIFQCPALTLKVKDTIGAGDAFFAVAGIMAACGAPTELSTLLGNIGGALGANIVGNREAVEKVNVLKYASTLLNV